MDSSFITTNGELGCYGDANVLFKAMLDGMKGIETSMTLTLLEMEGQPILVISMGMNRHILQLFKYLTSSFVVVLNPKSCSCLFVSVVPLRGLLIQ
jgi:hypothetical protein